MSSEAIALQPHNAQRPAPEPVPQTAPKKAKDPYFSNAKLLLIIGVVCGHSWAGLISESHSVRAFYMTLYDFHMPAFILLCGYFSKSFTGRPDQLRRLVTGVVAPYLIFSILYGGLRLWIDGEFNPSLLKPYYLTWFLAALFVWRITSPLWRLMRHPVAIAIVISIGSITMELPSWLDLGRVLQFLPFFVAGMYLKREHFEVLKRPLIRYTLTVLSLGVVSTAFMYGGDLNRNWIYFNEGAGQMDIGPGTALSLKLVLMVTSVILLATFFAWIPDKQTWFTRLGEFTMFTFLLHGFIVKAAEDGLHLYDHPIVHTAIGAVAVTLLAVGLAFLLMSKPVRWLTGPIIEPKLNWLLRPPSNKSARNNPVPEPTS